MQKCPGGEGWGHNIGTIVGMKEEGAFYLSMIRIRPLICRANLAQMGMCRCTDCGLLANRLLTISLFTAFCDMVGRKEPCSCPRQFLGASASEKKQEVLHWSCF